MKQAHSLAIKLKPLLGWHQSHIDLLALFIFGLIQTGSVNLTRIARTMGPSALTDSHNKRLKRFLRSFDLNFDQIAQLITCISAPEGRWILSLDRTNWQKGTFKINILVLAITVDEVAIPILWTLLPKKGNSNTEERIVLMKRFLRIFGLERIDYLTADREFKGIIWIKWLQKKRIPFRIRIANNTLIQNRNGNRSLHATRLFSLKANECMVLNKARRLWETQVWVGGFRSAKEHVIVISSHKTQTILDDYCRRWSIETLFQSLKKRGFNLEETGLRDMERVERLFAVVALSFCWCHHAGYLLDQTKPIKILKHGRPAKSKFRYGWDYLCTLIFNTVGLGQQIDELVAHINNRRPKIYAASGYF